MLSGNSEVSCLNKDFSDANDNFIIECDKQEKGSIIRGNSSFYIRNAKLNSYLYSSKYNNFHENNCGSRCPIIGQLEVSGVSSRNANCRWKVETGIFIEEDLSENDMKETKWIIDESESKDIKITDTDL